LLNGKPEFAKHRKPEPDILCFVGGEKPALLPEDNFYSFTGGIFHWLTIFGSK
jgi:hypothetical protein